jgi:DnaJ-like protein/exodeoxyribonuclease X-like protein
MSGKNDSGFDPYRVLQVDPQADAEIIQVVYRRLARMYHPDVMPGPEAAARMTEINTAMEILGDPERRAAYDRGRDFQDAVARNAAAAAEAAEAAAAGSDDTAGPMPGGPAGSTSSGGEAWDSKSRPTGGRGQSGGGKGPTGSTKSPSGARSGPAEPAKAPPPHTVSPDWTMGRSTIGGVYDPSQMRTPDGEGAAGPPPGNPSGTVLNFGRYNGWSLGEVARRDLEYLEWLDRMAIGRTYREEIDVLLRQYGRRRASKVDDERRGLFRRR